MSNWWDPITGFIYNTGQQITQPIVTPIVNTLQANPATATAQPVTQQPSQQQIVQPVQQQQPSQQQETITVPYPYLSVYTKPDSNRSTTPGGITADRLEGGFRAVTLGVFDTLGGINYPGTNQSVFPVTRPGGKDLVVNGKQYPYGEYSLWGEGVSKMVQTIPGVPSPEQSEKNIQFYKSRYEATSNPIEKGEAWINMAGWSANKQIVQHPEDIMTTAVQFVAIEPVMGPLSVGSGNVAGWGARKIGASVATQSAVRKGVTNWAIPAVMTTFLAGEVTKNEQGQMFSDFSGPNTAIRTGQIAPSTAEFVGLGLISGGIRNPFERTKGGGKVGSTINEPGRGKTPTQLRAEGFRETGKGVWTKTKIKEIEGAGGMGGPSDHWKIEMGETGGEFDPGNTGRYSKGGAPSGGRGGGTKFKEIEIEGTSGNVPAWKPPEQVKKLTWTDISKRAKTESKPTGGNSGYGGGYRGMGYTEAKFETKWVPKTVETEVPGAGGISTIMKTTKSVKTEVKLKQPKIQTMEQMIKPYVKVRKMSMGSFKKWKPLEKVKEETVPIYEDTDLKSKPTFKQELMEKQDISLQQMQKQQQLQRQLQVQKLKQTTIEQQQQKQQQIQIQQQKQLQQQLQVQKLKQITVQKQPVTQKTKLDQVTVLKQTQITKPIQDIVIPRKDITITKTTTPVGFGLPFGGGTGGGGGGQYPLSRRFIKWQHKNLVFADIHGKRANSKSGFAKRLMGRTPFG